MEQVYIDEAYPVAHPRQALSRFATSQELSDTPHIEARSRQSVAAGKYLVNLRTSHLSYQGHSRNPNPSRQFHTISGDSYADQQPLSIGTSSSKRILRRPDEII